MIFLDNRAGSSDYLGKLQSLGAEVELTTLPFGDACWYASGRVLGVELKKVPDVLNCIVTGRLSGHQLPGLARDYAEAWLMVEGLWRPNPIDGVLEIYRGGWVPAQTGKRTWMFNDFDAFLTTLELKGGLRVKRTSTEDETARALYNLYRWTQNWDGHRSHLALNRAGRDAAIFTKPTLVRRVAAELPGIGFDKSGMIAGHFSTVRAMVDAPEKDWTKLPGIGKKMAKSIVASWDSEE